MAKKKKQILFKPFSVRTSMYGRKLVFMQKCTFSLMVLFPGRQNLTNQGMFGNSENMTMKSVEERGDYDSVVVNASAQLEGSQTYFGDSQERPTRLDLPSEEISPPREEKELESVSVNHPKNVDDQEHYLHSPGIALGDFKNTGVHYLTPFEVQSLNFHIQSFEQELRAPHHPSLSNRSKQNDSLDAEKERRNYHLKTALYLAPIVED